MKIWVDIESGSFGNADSIVFIDVSDWSIAEIANFSELSDDERSSFANEIYLINEVSP